jgi:hypothetical protein
LCQNPFFGNVAVAGGDTSIFYSGEIFSSDVVVGWCCGQSKPDKILLIQAEIDTPGQLAQNSLAELVRGTFTMNHTSHVRMEHTEGN